MLEEDIDVCNWIKWSGNVKIKGLELLSCGFKLQALPSRLIVTFKELGHMVQQKSAEA